MEGARPDLLAPTAPSLRVASLALAVAATRLVDAAAPTAASALARVGAAVLALLLALLPTFLERGAVAWWRSRGAAPWEARRRAAQAALAVGLLLTAIGVALREALAEGHLLMAARAPWPLEELVAVQALLFVAQLLPLPGSDGATLIELALLRGRPQLVAMRLAGRLRGSGVALLVLLLALLPGGGRDPLALALAAGLALWGMVRERATFRLALARERALQARGDRSALDRATPLRPLAPAQYVAFAEAAERAYERLCGAFASSTQPIASASSSTPTEPE
ncbi:MAG: hypothetical protein JNL90_07520 [Planctomycetes bacterium]|nr:hypothetical protein [Planctomycetota bacterium]